MYSLVMGKEATNSKLSMQRKWYCLAVHKKKNNNLRTYLSVCGSRETDCQKVSGAIAFLGGGGEGGNIVHTFILHGFMQ